MNDDAQYRSPESKLHSLAMSAGMDIETYLMEAVHRASALQSSDTISLSREVAEDLLRAPFLTQPLLV